MSATASQGSGAGTTTPTTSELCLNLVEEFAKGNISKAEAIQEIIGAFRESSAHENVTSSQVQSAIAAFVSMLDQAQSSREDAARRGGAGVPRRTEADPEEDAPGATEPECSRVSGSPEPQATSGRRGTDESLFAWAHDEDSQIHQLTPSQELTRKLVRNQTADIKLTKHNLFSARGLPEFPDSEWVKVIQGKAVDFDVVFSGIHSTVSDNRATESFGDFEFRFGHTKPSKVVKNHGDWLIAFSSFQRAMRFIFPHREAELIRYSEYISSYFASIDAAAHFRVLDLDKAIRKWSGSVNSVSLDELEKFKFLEIRHLFSQVAADNSSGSGQRASGSAQKSSNSTWRSKDPCRLHNQGKCSRQASECKYRHVCSGCGKDGHTERDCPAKKI